VERNGTGQDGKVFKKEKCSLLSAQKTFPFLLKDICALSKLNGKAYI